MNNRLAEETSPYLLQHADNPVDWYPWSEEALEKAAREGKPIFLSIGYAACHWCHVMAHESFEDPDTAALMNAHFVNVKVDREERPDLDSVYMDAVVAMTGQGGWPLSVFLTPSGEPFFGGTYFPPEPRYNMPSFREVLVYIAELWEEERERVRSQASDLTERITAAPALRGGDRGLEPETFDLAAEVLFRSYDWQEGGWGRAPKFPQPKVVEFLLRRHQREGDKLALDMARHVLRSMAQGGMYDLIGGGFHRYSVDDKWLVPHFEKMLYDNALLARLYLVAGLVTGERFYYDVATETIEFLRREMRDEAGGFYASLDADSEGVEGKFYTWGAEELEEALGQDLLVDLARRAYGITEQGDFEGKNIPYRAANVALIAEETGLAIEETEANLTEAKSRLLQRRETRIRPALDDKILASWNGLLLQTLSTAAQVLDRTRFLPMAQQLAGFLLSEMTREGRLMRSWRRGEARIPAFLEDHAAVGLGLLELYAVDFDRRWYEAAVEQAAQVLTRFEDPQGGFFDTSSDRADLITRPKSLQDSPTPSGNTMAAGLMLRLYALEGETRYAEAGEKMIAGMQRAAARHPTAFAGWLCELDFLLGPQLQLAIVGTPGSQTFQALAQVAYGRYAPRLVIAGGSPDEKAGPALLQGRALKSGAATAYLCQGFSCDLPVDEPQALDQQLEEALHIQELGRR